MHKRRGSGCGGGSGDGERERGRATNKALILPSIHTVVAGPSTIPPTLLSVIVVVASGGRAREP